MLISVAVKPVSVVTLNKQPFVFEAQYVAIPNVYLKSSLTCIEQPPALKGQLTFRLVWVLLKDRFESILKQTKQNKNQLNQK